MQKLVRGMDFQSTSLGKPETMKQHCFRMGSLWRTYPTGKVPEPSALEKHLETPSSDDLRTMLQDAVEHEKLSGSQLKARH